MRLFIGFITLCCLLVSCNLRENALLPPHLDPSTYETGNRINVYADYLVKSANDNAYLYIPKSSIADSLLHYNDLLIFERSDELASRDSVFIPQGSSKVTNTYTFAIVRSDTLVSITAPYEIAKIYGDKEGQSTGAWLLGLSSLLQMERPAIAEYGKNRISFGISASGDYGLYQVPDNAQLQISNVPQNVDTYAVLCSASLVYSLLLPSHYTTSAGTTTISLADSLSVAEIDIATSVLGPFALLHRPLHIKTANSVSLGNLAFLRISLAQAKVGDMLWVRLNSLNTAFWESSEYLGLNNLTNWVHTPEASDTFITGSGKYFYATQVSIGDRINIPLDGRFSKIYLSGHWFDLRDVSLPGYSMEIRLNQDASGIVQDYFSNNPFSIEGSAEVFEMSFKQGSTYIDRLPNELWIEYGRHNHHESYASLRLFQIKRTEAADLLTYKTMGTAYDETHFFVANSYVYAGYSDSAVYILGKIRESSPMLTIPVIKPEAQIQTEELSLGWSQALPTSGQALLVNTDIPNIPAHPWFTGEPLMLSAPRPILSIYPNQRRSSKALPANLWLNINDGTINRDLLLFDDSGSYPRLRQYIPSATSTKDTYTSNNNGALIYPSYYGTIVEAAISTPVANTFNLKLYPRIEFALADLQLYHTQATADLSSAYLRISRTTFPDQFAILSTQYQFHLSSPVYRFEATPSDLLNIFQPLVYLKRNQRSGSYLLSESYGEFYRFYPYPYSTSTDGFHYGIADNFSTFYLSHEGYFASATDSNPHAQIIMPISNLNRDFHLSLYQAQFSLPQLFLGTTIPIGSSARLEKLSSVAGVPNILSAYRLTLQNPQSQNLEPNFFAIAGATISPFIYVPIDNPGLANNCRLFYRNNQGISVELIRVQSFSTNFANEFIVRGNSLIAMVNNPGIFYSVIR